MSNYYRSQRTRNLFDPNSEKPFRLSRTKIELFQKCRRCFYFDRKLGVGQPPGYPFTLNSAVDALLKREFDAYRVKAEAHPEMIKNGIKAIPFSHEKLEEWRDSLHKGIQFHHDETNLLLTGGVDDLWVNENGELIIVDYKATAKNKTITIDEDWQISYKRQMEFYAWLFRQNGFRISPIGFFVYCNGDSSRPDFDGKLHFRISIIPYQIDDSWVLQTIRDAHRVLIANDVPEQNPDCDFCQYREAANAALKRSVEFAS